MAAMDRTSASTALRKPVKSAWPNSPTFTSVGDPSNVMKTDWLALSIMAGSGIPVTASRGGSQPITNR